MGHRRLRHSLLHERRVGTGWCYHGTANHSRRASMEHEALHGHAVRWYRFLRLPPPPPGLCMALQTHDV
ncbi:unnamed protein product [Symbiodinium necroappetens]|uniref:Uncharacterized protein n=1 Tax=Symbiodinium necroappetens TaxID=1628268 RepID=A0A813ASH4_9DINO|nr:unnamed protein product [Symbiodinium necroappetens]